MNVIVPSFSDRFSIVVENSQSNSTFYAMVVTETLKCKC